MRHAAWGIQRMLAELIQGSKGLSLRQPLQLRLASVSTYRFSYAKSFHLISQSRGFNP